MPDALTNLIPALPIAAALGIFGGLLPVFFSIKRTLRAYVQHAAAGLVTAVIAVELFPDLRAYDQPAAALIGFAVGAAFMVALKRIASRLEHRKMDGLPVGMAAAAAFDTAIDGLIVGAGFAVDPRMGTLLAIGLGLELGALNMALAAEFLKSGASRAVTFGVVGLNGTLLIAGAVAGSLLLQDASDVTFTVVLSFSCAALLYLVTEELLVRGNEDADTAATSAVFFMAFLSLMALTMLQ